MPSLVTITIHDVAGPAELAVTRTALARHTPEPHDLVLLCQKPEAARPAPVPGASVEATAGELPALLLGPGEGAPAGLNRLLTSSSTPYILLLESGAVVTPGWLGRLLAPLADGDVALSGPSTNRSWNEQQVSLGSHRPPRRPAEVEAYAARVLGRFADRTVALDTLHSLASFCYLFKRDVARELGGFDEAYGAGPCWEIDFNTRAARAGYRALWVCGAYVHRGAPAARQVRIQRRTFVANKHLYQDRFCGLRLRGETQRYEAHCRGEACEHFAPPDLIQITLAPSPAGQEEAPVPPSPEPALRSSISSHSPAPAPLPRLDALSVSASPQPMVTCTMPTHGRRDWVLQSVRYFQRQGYPQRELLIVDDAGPSSEDLAAALPDDPRIRYVPIEPGLSIGAKRNRACELARGEIIAQWDDDDWYAPQRLTAQVAPILVGQADMTGLEAGVLFDLEAWRFWRCTPALHRRLFIGDVHGGTLVFRRDVWGRLARYPDRSLAEDGLFLRQALARGAQLSKLPNEGLFVYVRHGNNAWSFVPGRYIDPGGWEPAIEPPYLAQDRAFYAGMAQGAPRSAPAAAARPLVTCIMPTAARRAFVPLALAYFARQDYSPRELIVVDDGPDPVADLMPADPAVRYIHLRQRRPLGEKRNTACEAAKGELIVHWDDDDWMAPDRLSRQVAALFAHDADVCGLDRVPYYEPGKGRAWEYVYPPGGRPWVAGNTLCYRRAVWRHTPFLAVNIGEDNRFLWSAGSKKVVAIAARPPFMIGLIHATNASPKRTTHPRWQVYPVDAIRALMGEDWARYPA
jgi:glycosyltransferase involved in cell wall biosynthesis